MDVATSAVPTIHLRWKKNASACWYFASMRLKEESNAIWKRDENEK